MLLLTGHNLSLFVKGSQRDKLRKHIKIKTITMRHNIFNQVHLPLKHALLTTCIYLCKEDCKSIAGAKLAVQKVQEIIPIFKEQLKYETNYVLPLVFVYEPSIWDAYTMQHQKAMNLLNDLEVLISSFKNAKDKKDQLFLMSSLHEAYDDFMMFNYHHMDEEEEVLNEILWRYYNDKVLTNAVEQFNEVPSVLHHYMPVTVLQKATAA
jgi:hypothetical protein